MIVREKKNEVKAETQEAMCIRRSKIVENSWCLFFFSPFFYYSCLSVTNNNVSGASSARTSVIVLQTVILQCFVALSPKTDSSNHEILREKYGFSWEVGVFLNRKKAFVVPRPLQGDVVARRYPHAPGESSGLTKQPT